MGSFSSRKSEVNLYAGLTICSQLSLEWYTLADDKINAALKEDLTVTRDIITFFIYNLERA